MHGVGDDPGRAADGYILVALGLFETKSCCGRSTVHVVHTGVCPKRKLKPTLAQQQQTTKILGPQNISNSF